MSLRPETRRALLEGRDQIWASHHGDPNFTGCGIGYRRRNGAVTYEPVVIAMVVDKLPSGALSSKRLMPESVHVGGKDYGVDVIEAGPVYASGSPSLPPRSVTNSGPVTGGYRPLVQGCGVSNADVIYDNPNPSGPKTSPSPAGTIGCFATDAIGDIYLVSAGHILASGPNDWVPGNQAYPGHIVQPALIDQAQTGTQYSTPVAVVSQCNTLDTTPGSQSNVVDCAAALINSDSGGAQPTFANDWMPAISATHPAVGMCIASDSEGNSFLTDAGATFTTLNLTPLGTNSIAEATTTAQVGMNIEKVGRTSGYTSSTVDATDVIVDVNFIDTANNAYVTITMSGLIWTQFFQLAGDSGAIACQGGNGQTLVPPPNAPCQLLSDIQTYYALPTNLSDNNLTNNLQAKVLTQTAIGNLAVGIIYGNAQTVIERLNTMTGPAYNQATAQAFFQQIYATYRPVAVSAVTSPATTMITSQMATDFANSVKMLGNPANGGQGLLLPDEEALGDQLSSGLAYWTANGDWTIPQFENLVGGASTYDWWYSQMVLYPSVFVP